jgi:4-amino-4-deoxy-L-arabinose transferase-like glycosyltransferase
VFTDTFKMGETRAHRALCATLAVAIAAAFLLALSPFRVPAHPGVDQMGYLVGGRLLAEHGSTVFRALNPVIHHPDPFRFVGRMWVSVDADTPRERYYPQHPFGYPLFVALAFKLAGPARGLSLAYGINPVCMAFALLGSFVLVRRFAGSFAGLLAMLVLAASPLTWRLANNPNSHASALCVVTWGMCLLLDWGDRGGWPRALGAGLLLGYAATIRYTEGLMLLPVLVVTGLRAHRERDARDTLVPLAAWAVPVVTVLLVNQTTIGAATAYRAGHNLDFGWGFFRMNGAIVFRLLSSEGLFLLFPLALVGLPLMFRLNARLALVLAAWILPSAALYTSYYWAPDNLGYLRYFFTIFPALLVCAFWWLRPALERFAPRPIACVAIGALALLSSAAGLRGGLANAAADFAENAALQQRAAIVLAAAPTGSVLFTQDAGLLNHLRLVGDYALYDLTPLARKALVRRAGGNENRYRWKLDADPRMAVLTHEQIVRRQNEIAAECLDAGLRVFVARNLEQPPEVLAPADGFTARVVTRWTEPALDNERAPGPWGLIELSRPRP